MLWTRRLLWLTLMAMREVIREGAPIGNLGRHGSVATGDHLFVTEQEFNEIRQSADWLEVDKGTDDLVAEAAPVWTEEYDLTTIDWTEANLYGKLKKMGHARLNKIASALNSLGIYCPVGFPETPEQVLDGILEKADRQGWTGRAS